MRCTTTLLFLGFLLFSAFTLGRYYQINFNKTHPESESTRQIVERFVDYHG